MNEPREDMARAIYDANNGLPHVSWDLAPEAVREHMHRLADAAAGTLVAHILAGSTVIRLDPDDVIGVHLPAGVTPEGAAQALRTIRDVLGEGRRLIGLADGASLAGYREVPA